MPNSPLRLAMWSGPRNVSSALMRSFDARADTVVSDEPLYAHYLKVTGLAHPAREETLAQHETDWRKVVRELTEAPLPAGATVFYQKHMAHHLLDGMAGSWLDKLTHVFLIREPAAMLASLIRVWPEPTLADTGLPQQVALYEALCDKRGSAPPVVDSAELLRNPRAMLSMLCASVGLEFDPAMLSWESGPRDTDGVWGPHWYANLYRSTGFAPYVESEPELPPSMRGLLDEARALYQRLYEQRLTP